MKQICTQCERTAIHGNLWCQESNCPINFMPRVLGFGEPFGEFEIIRLVTVLNSSTVYQAIRGEENVYLKIAHEGFQNRLKREAELLMQLQQQEDTHPMLPTLLPAHRDTNRAYGKTAIGKRMHYYNVFEFVEGDLLRELLFKNPQPWYKHTGWITSSLSDVIAFIHDKQRIHAALYPECVLIHFDNNKREVPRVLLLDLGFSAPIQNISTDWNPQLVPPAYTAPELLNGQASYSTDVYGVGLLLHEMLSGQPTYPYRLRTQNEILSDVRAGRYSQIGRTDLQTLPQVAQRALSKEPRQRFQTMLDISSKLQETLPPVPKVPRKRRFEMNTLLIVLGIIICITLILATAINLSDLTPY